jgi:hypothetical protein
MAASREQQLSKAFAQISEDLRDRLVHLSGLQH